MEAYSESRPQNPTFTMITNRGGLTTTERTSRTYVHSLTGFRNPKWKDQVRRHVNATTPLIGTDSGFSLGHCEMYSVWVSSTGVSVPMYRTGSLGQIVSGMGLPAPPTPALDNRALTKFYGAASAVQERASGLEFLAELRQTMGLLKRPFSALRDLLVKRERYMRRRWFDKENRVHWTRSSNGITGRRLQNALADTWLETVFGLQPLVHDIEDISSYLQGRRFELGKEYFQISGVARDKPQVSQTYAGLIRPHGNSVTGITAYSRDEVRPKVAYKGEVVVDPLNAWVDWRDFKRLGVTLHRFAPTLWEITPWSFLVDYVADVGGLIDSFNVPLSSIAWFNKTLRSEMKRSVFLAPPVIASGSTGGGNERLQYTSFSPFEDWSRRVTRTGGGGNSLPRPTIVWDLPNGKQLVNIIALAQSESRKRFSTIG